MYLNMYSLKLKRLCRWSLVMDKHLHPTIYNGYDYLSTLGLKLIHVSKKDPSFVVIHSIIIWIIKSYNKMSQMKNIQIVSYHHVVELYLQNHYLLKSKCFYKTSNAILIDEYKIIVLIHTSLALGKSYHCILFMLTTHHQCVWVNSPQESLRCYEIIHTKQRAINRLHI